MIGEASSRNSYGTTSKRGTGGELEGVMSARPTYVCVKCQCTFKDYKGMKRVGKGLGYCPEHLPVKKQPEEATPCATA